MPDTEYSNKLGLDTNKFFQPRPAPNNNAAMLDAMRAPGGALDFSSAATTQPKPSVITPDFGLGHASIKITPGGQKGIGRPTLSTGAPDIAMAQRLNYEMNKPPPKAAKTESGETKKTERKSDKDTSQYDDPEHGEVLSIEGSEESGMVDILYADGTRRSIWTDIHGQRHDEIMDQNYFTSTWDHSPDAMRPQGYGNTPEEAYANNKSGNLDRWNDGYANHRDSGEDVDKALKLYRDYADDPVHRPTGWTFNTDNRGWVQPTNPNDPSTHYDFYDPYERNPDAVNWRDETTITPWSRVISPAMAAPPFEGFSQDKLKNLAAGINGNRYF